MNGDRKHTPEAQRLYSLAADHYVARLRDLCAQDIIASDYPLCDKVTDKVPIYHLSRYSAVDEHTLSALQDEWHKIMHTGPGVFVLKQFYSTQDLEVIDATNKTFDKIIEDEASLSRGDHFAASNANSRIWNSLQKHALHDPTSFIQYYSNPWLKHVCEAWLGPDYTVTAQVNIVRPGGKPQMPHRDYHLGFQTAEQCAKWPKTMHGVSQFLTLQGAVAHSDMPLESGPTRLLPFSQLLEDGFMAWRDDGVKEFFAKNWISLPLQKGDGIFFNPALIHAAGENLTIPGETGIDRSANLLQVSSAFGKTMENINHDKILSACWQPLLAQVKDGRLGGGRLDALISAMTDSYPFPTNLDQRPPAPGGMAPESQAQIVRRLLQKGEDIDTLRNEMENLKSTSGA